MKVVVELELNDKQVKEMMERYACTEEEVQDCLNELVTFVKDDPVNLLEQLDWFNF